MQYLVIESVSVDLAGSLLRSANLHRGEKRRQFLVRACEEYQRLAKNSPPNAHLLYSWGYVVFSVGVSAPDREADRLLALAEAKFSEALAIAPGDKNAISGLVCTLLRRVRFQHGEDANQFLWRADELLQAALRENPDWEHGLCCRASLLYERTKRRRGEETDRLLAEATDQFEVATQLGADPNKMLPAWAILLWAKATSVDGETSVRLLREAKHKLTVAESQTHESQAYSLACLCAELGELDECRHWLEQSREPGILVGYEEMVTEQELESVRECPWFRKLLANQPRRQSASSAAYP